MLFDFVLRVRVLAIAAACGRTLLGGPFALIVRIFPFFCFQDYQSFSSPDTLRSSVLQTNEPTNRLTDEQMKGAEMKHSNLIRTATVRLPKGLAVRIEFEY